MTPSNLLTWTTANEINNKGFQIERAPQPPKGALTTWEILGFVNAKGKAATYEFTDKAPFGGWGLYRLRQIDNDGKETFSKVVTVSANKGNSKLKAYPNPVSNVLTVETDNAGAFEIHNILGQTVISGKAAQRIDVAELVQGTYILKVGTEQVKFIKQ
jgi:Secretion system C-terminal sorting domain